MKTLKLVCCKCGIKQIFRGKNVDGILKLVDLAGWVGCDDICPMCAKKEG